MHNEKQLISNCIEGQRSAQQQLFSLLAPKIMGVAVRYLANQEEAKDQMQEIMLKIFGALHSFKAEAKVSTWATRIAVNHLISYLRKQKKSMLYIESDISELNRDFSDLQEDDEFLVENTQQAISALSKLPDMYRTVFNLFAIDELSHAEIGKLLGISETNSRTYLSRSRKLISKELQSKAKSVTHGR